MWLSRLPARKIPVWAVVFGVAWALFKRYRPRWKPSCRSIGFGHAVDVCSQQATKFGSKSALAAADPRTELFVEAAAKLHSRDREVYGEDAGVTTSVIHREVKAPGFMVVAPVVVAAAPVVVVGLVALWQGLSQCELFLLLALAAVAVGCCVVAALDNNGKLRIEALHATAAIRPEEAAAVRQAASTWAAQAPAGRLRSFARRTAELAFLIEADVALPSVDSAASKAPMKHDKFDAFVFESASGVHRGGAFKVHYYSAQSLSRGVASAAPLVAGQLRTFLNTAGRDVILNATVRGAPVAAQARAEADLAWRASRKTAQRTDDDGAGRAHECVDGLAKQSPPKVA